MTKIWAHRGASAYAPENTLEAFAQAAKMGSDGIELDVHETKDGEIVVCHDERIDRTSNGTGRILDMTLSELKKYHFNKLFPNVPEYANATIPTLQEVYALVEPTGMTVNVELKTDAIEYDRIAEKCVAIAEKTGMTGRVIYSSFNHKSLRELLLVKPDAETGLLYGETDIPQAEKYAVAQQAKALHPWFGHMLKEGAVKRAHDLGIRVHPWTVNEEEDMKELLALGADAIITNKPDVALRLRDGEKTRP